VGFTSQHDRGRTSEWKIILAADQNSWRAFLMGRKIADRFGAPLVNVPGTIQGNGSNDRRQRQPEKTGQEDSLATWRRGNRNPDR
jgi:hypothetical protein